MKTKKYNLIIISPNVEKPKIITASVTTQFLNKLEKLKLSGGFKRFEIDIVDEVQGYSNDHRQVAEFLKENNLGF